MARAIFIGPCAYRECTHRIIGRAFQLAVRNGNKLKFYHCCDEVCARKLLQELGIRSTTRCARNGCLCFVNGNGFYDVVGFTKSGDPVFGGFCSKECADDTWKEIMEAQLAPAMRFRMMRPGTKWWR